MIKQRTVLKKERILQLVGFKDVEVTLYTTSDGKEFVDKVVAEEHEAVLTSEELVRTIPYKGIVKHDNTFIDLLVNNKSIHVLVVESEEQLNVFITNTFPKITNVYNQVLHYKAQKTAVAVVEIIGTDEDCYTTKTILIIDLYRFIEYFNEHKTVIRNIDSLVEAAISNL